MNAHQIWIAAFLLGVGTGLSISLIIVCVVFFIQIDHSLIHMQKVIRGED